MPASLKVFNNIGAWKSSPIKPITLTFPLFKVEIFLAAFEAAPKIILVL